MKLNGTSDGEQYQVSFKKETFIILKHFYQIFYSDISMLVKLVFSTTSMINSTKRYQKVYQTTQQAANHQAICHSGLGFLSTFLQLVLVISSELSPQRNQSDKIKTKLNLKIEILII